jgi:hypothetical protein
MSSMKSARMQDHVAELTDPRRREVIYPLINVVVIAICAVICGALAFGVQAARVGPSRRGRPVNPAVNSSKLAIGQERDATNHPGRESFDGELARFLVFERPLTKDELQQAMDSLKKTYAIR